MDWHPLVEVGRHRPANDRLRCAFQPHRKQNEIHVLIIGRNLHDCFGYLAQHRVHRPWALPKDWAAAEEGSPVVHAIDTKEADSQTMADLLFGD
jgi:hypothetical protein